MNKKNIVALLILFCAWSVCSQREEISLDTGTTISLKDAIASLNNKGTIAITGTINIDTNITVPEEIRLNIKESGFFNISSKSILTIKGELQAGTNPIFNNPMVFTKGSVQEVNSEWFGSNDLAVNYALLSSGKIPVRITKDISVTNSIYISSNQTLIINDSTLIKVTNEMRGASVITNRNLNDNNITISGGKIDGTAATTSAYDAILFNNVSNSTINNLSCVNVHTTASQDTGNIRLNNCSYTSIENCNVTGTWKMGIFILNGSCNSILGGHYYGTHDSAVGVVNCPGSTIDGLYVDNCGTSDGSNMSLNSQHLLIINNTSINASGNRNGNGMTIGHDGASASYSVCSNNLISNNNAKGIFIQGSNTTNVIITENKIINNGIYSKGTNSGGIAVYSLSRSHLIDKNEINGNRLGISLNKTSKEVLISNNKITNSTLFGIRNDGENIVVKNNYLSNTINIKNEKNSKNLFLNNNIVKSE